MKHAWNSGRRCSCTQEYQDREGVRDTCVPNLPTSKVTAAEPRSPPPTPRTIRQRLRSRRLKLQERESRKSGSNNNNGNHGTSGQRPLPRLHSAATPSRVCCEWTPPALVPQPLAMAYAKNLARWGCRQGVRCVRMVRQYE